MKAKYIVLTAVVAVGALLLDGCDILLPNTWEPQESAAISISKDGVITEYIRETLDADYYDAQELEDMIYSEVEAYNAKYGEDSVKVNDFEAENGNVNLQMEYASAEDYSQFNNIEFYYGSMINAELAGYLFDVSYSRIEDGTVSAAGLSGSEVIKEMDKQVLIVKAPLEIKVPGTVLYISSNAEMLASDVVNAIGEQDEEETEEEEEEEGLVLPSNAVYRKHTEEEETTYSDEIDANRVYIVFDIE